VSTVVSLPALDEVLERMAAYDRHVEQQLDRIDAQARNLAASWSGNAAASYAGAHAECTTDLACMRSALRALREAVATAHGNYTAAIAANRAMWH
jgi:WXG100 family type VII secretion target